MQFFITSLFATIIYELVIEVHSKIVSNNPQQNPVNPSKAMLLNAKNKDLSKPSPNKSNLEKHNKQFNS